MTDRAARHVSYLGYAPTVFLYDRYVGPVSRIEGEAFQIDFERDPDAVTKFLQDGKPLPKKYRIPVRLSISCELWFGIGPMETHWAWAPVFEKRLLFCIQGYQGSDNNRYLRVNSYDPTIVSLSTAHGGEIPSRLIWLHQFTLLPRCRDGARLSFSVSPHIDTSELVGSDDVQREHLEDRWLIALDRFDNQSLAVDEDIEAGNGQFFYEAVDLASCTKYLDQVADPDDWDEFESECASVTLNSRLWQYEEKEAWYQDFSMGDRPAMYSLPREEASPGRSSKTYLETMLLTD